MHEARPHSVRSLAAAIALLALLVAAGSGAFHAHDLHDLTDSEQNCSACALAGTVALEAPCDLGITPPQPILTRADSGACGLDLAARSPEHGRAPPSFC